MQHHSLLYVECAVTGGGRLAGADPEWPAHPQGNDFTIALRLMNDTDCHIGITHFSPGCPGLCNPELKGILFSKSDLKRVAVLAGQALADMAVPGLVSPHSHDHRLPPPDTHHLHATRDHVYA